MAPGTNPKIEELRFKLKADPKSRLFYQLAEELRKNGQLDEAERILHTGLTFYPTYLAAWVSLGRVLRDQKNDAAAVDALTKALQLDPGNVVAARILADAYLALGQKLEALKKYKLVGALLSSDEELRNIIDGLERDLQAPAAIPVEPEPLDEAPVIQEAEPAAMEAAPPEAEPSPFAEPEPSSAEPPLFADEPEAFAASTSEPEDGYPAVVDYAPPPRPQAGFAPYFTPAGSAPAEQDESPFDKTTPPFSEAALILGEEVREEQETGDAEPMSRAHEESPFEEPAAGYTADALAIEAPSGMHIESAPLAAEVPSWTAEDLPAVDSTPVFDTPAEVPPAQPDDVASTVTMADLYVRQGLLDDARQIYETILARDPANDDVRAKLAAIVPRPEPPAAPVPPVAGAVDAPVDRRVAALEGWLGKVTKREAGHV